MDLLKYRFIQKIVGDLTTCHTQYTWDSSICVFLFNRRTLQVFVTYLTGALYVHRLWFYRVIFVTYRTGALYVHRLWFYRVIFVKCLTGALYVQRLWLYKHQHDNRIRSKLFVACNNLQFRDTCGKRRNINLILDVTP